MVYGAGIFIIIVGIALRLFPPKYKNYVYGYRTPLSYSSKKAWDICQIYGGYALMVCGVFIEICGMLISIYKPALVGNEGALIVFSVFSTIGVVEILARIKLSKEEKIDIK